MKCPWCSDSVLKTSLKKCLNCGHEFSESLQTRISTLLRLERNYNELIDIAKQTKEAADEIKSEIDVLESQTAEEALMVEEAESAFAELPGTEHKTKASAPEQAVKTPAPEPAETQETPELQQTPTADKQNPEEAAGIGIEARLGQKWLPIIGVITVIFGVGYFLKYAIDQGWVSPLQRILLAYGWGGTFIAAGHYLRKRGYAAYGLTVIGGGMATLYFSTFAAHYLYHIIGQTPTFLIMFFITLAAGVISVYYKSMWLAVLGLFGGYFTPLMLSTGSNNYAFLFIYLGILSGGILGIAYYRRWPLLHYLGFIGTYMLYGLWYSRHFDRSPFWPAMVAIGLYFIAYAFVPFAYRFFDSQESEDGMLAKGDVALIILNSFLAFSFNYSMISTRFSTEAVSIAAFFYSAMFSAMAWLIYTRLRSRPRDFGIFASNSGLFLAVGVALMFSNYWITFFWAVQAAGLYWAAMRIHEHGMLRKGALLLMGMAYAQFFYDYSALGFSMNRWAFVGGYTASIVERATLIVGVMGSLIGMVLTHKRYGVAISHGGYGIEQKYKLTIVCGSGLMLFYLLNAEVSGFFHDYMPNARFASISVLWTVFSAVLMALGFRWQVPILRKLSIGLFFATLLKVFFADISRIDTPYRILSFIVLGTVLVCVSYLYHRFHDRLSQALGASAEEDLGDT